MQLRNVTVGVGWLLTLLLGYRDNQNSLATDIKADNGHSAGDNQNSEVNNQELTTLGKFIALEGEPLPAEQGKELKKYGLAPSAYQLHRVAADGDCDNRVSVLGIRANVLIDKKCPFEEFTKRTKESAKEYAAKDPRFAQHAQIEKRLQPFKRCKASP